MRYKTAIIGSGNIGAFFDNPNATDVLTHAHAFYRNEKFELVGFYDIDNRKSQEAADRWGTKAFTDLNRLIEYADIICCTVPDVYHFDILQQCANAKPKLIFAEKPIVKTMEEAKLITSLYQTKDIPVLVNYSRRFLKEFIELRASIDDFGELICATGYYGKGILHNGSHMIDLLRYLFGDCEVVSFGGSTYDCYEDDPTVDCVILAGGASVHLKGVDCRFVTIFELDLLFQKKRICIRDGGLLIEYYSIKESNTFTGYYNYTIEKILNVNYSNAMSNAVQNISDYLEGKNNLYCTLTDGIKVLELCCSMYMEE